jgi:hypothetical protein
VWQEPGDAGVGTTQRAVTQGGCFAFFCRVITNYNFWGFVLRKQKKWSEWRLKTSWRPRGLGEVPCDLETVGGWMWPLGSRKAGSEDTD